MICDNCEFTETVPTVFEADRLLLQSTVTAIWQLKYVYSDS